MAEETEAPEEEQVPSVTLTVKKSKIKAGGLARLHCDDMAVLLETETCEEIEAEEVDEKGDLIVVSIDDKHILVKAFHDTMMDEGTITLRPGDIEKLDSDEGDEVEVYLHKTLHQAASENWAGMKEKWSAWLEKVKDKFAKEGEEEVADED